MTAKPGLYLGSGRACLCITPSELALATLAGWGYVEDFGFCRKCGVLTFCMTDACLHHGISKHSNVGILIEHVCRALSGGAA